MKRLIPFVLAFAIELISITPVALAHGDRNVEDKKFTVGWANEPAFVGQLNAIQLFLEHDGEPAEGAEDTLQVEVSIGGETSEPLKLHTVFESPGEYQADLIPTAPGGYTFRFFGKVEDEKVDVSFTSPNDGFDEAEATADIAFPKAAPTNTELADRIETLDSDLADVKSSVGLPRVLGIVALALAVVALGVASRGRKA